MRNKRFMSLALSITMVLSLVLFNPISAFADDAKELVILHFNDTHARVKSVEKDGVVTGVGFDRIAQYKQDFTKGKSKRAYARCWGYSSWTAYSYT